MKQPKPKATTLARRALRAFGTKREHVTLRQLALAVLREDRAEREKWVRAAKQELRESRVLGGEVK